MPSRNEIFVQGSYFHIFNRTGHSQVLFHSPENYQYCLQLVSKNAIRFKISINAFCLMPNHYHFLMRPDGPDDGLSKCMGYSFNSYAQALNKQCRWRGPLFQDRFKAVGVDTDDSLIHVCRYIRLNPVKAGLAKTPEEWPYSDYRDWIGLNKGNYLKAELRNEYFKGGKDYKEFVCSLSADIQDKNLTQYTLE